MKKMRYRRHLSGESQYYSFIPIPLSEIVITHTEAMDQLIAETTESIRNLNARTRQLTDEQLNAEMEKEARKSCELALGKPGLFSAFMLCTPDNDVSEDTRNLLKATHYLLEARHELPLPGRLLRNAHYLACQSEKYEKKYPGEFRKSPVWIGKKGCNLRNALFVPPTEDDMTKAMADLEKYIHYATDEHVLVRAALIHYQFEMIHPFIDANGRMGRLLNLLFLLEYNVLERPAFCLSESLSHSAIQYYTELQKVNETGCYESWIMFFLSMLKKSALGNASWGKGW